jgi:hypothetical protein
VEDKVDATTGDGSAANGAKRARKCYVLLKEVQFDHSRWAARCYERQMTYENFLEQINLAEQLTSSEFGVSTGLISQQYWEQSKWYFVNVERGNIADKLQPRNINVSFNNKGWADCV